MYSATTRFISRREGYSSSSANQTRRKDRLDICLFVATGNKSTRLAAATVTPTVVIGDDTTTTTMTPTNTLGDPTTDTTLTNTPRLDDFLESRRSSRIYNSEWGWGV